MRFEKTASLHGWTEITATRSEFDGDPPLPGLRIREDLTKGSSDRTVLGASLVFSPWVAGRCDAPSEFSALTAQRISEWFQLQGVWVAPGPVRTGGLPLPRGTRRLHLSGDPGPGDLQLQLLGPTQGGSEDEGLISIPTNAGTLISHAPDASTAFLMRLGVAVLLAESLDVAEIVDPELENADPMAFSCAARLLECTALGLSGR